MSDLFLQPTGNPSPYEVIRCSYERRGGGPPTRLPGEFADQFLHDPAAILSWPLSGEIWAFGRSEKAKKST